MSAYVPLVITRVAVDSTSWQALRAPQACDYVGFYAEGNTPVRLRTDPNDPNTEKRLPGGTQELITTPPSRFQRDSRFVQDEPVYWMQTVTAESSDVVVATWL